MACDFQDSPTVTVRLARYGCATSTTYCTRYRPFFDEMRALISNIAQRYVEEIFHPKNWRWFHAFSCFARVVLDRPRVEIVASLHRAQERFPAVQRRARKRRAFIVQLRRAG